jgi:hypothetical protein
MSLFPHVSRQAPFIVQPSLVCLVLSAWRDMPSRLNRCYFVQTVAVGLSAASETRSRAAAPSRWRFLTENEAVLVDAITEQIVPAD